MGQRLHTIMTAPLKLFEAFFKNIFLFQVLSNEITLDNSLSIYDNYAGFSTDSVAGPPSWEIVCTTQKYNNHNHTALYCPIWQNRLTLHKTGKVRLHIHVHHHRQKGHIEKREHKDVCQCPHRTLCIYQMKHFSRPL